MDPDFRFLKMRVGLRRLTSRIDVLTARPASNTYSTLSGARQAHR
jgi:hypothetical protein